MAENLGAKPDGDASLSEMFSRVTSRFSENLSSSFAGYSAIDYVRMIAIIGGYLLLRPYLQQLGAKYQERDHARQIDENEESSGAATGAKARIIAGEDDVDAAAESSDDEGGDVSWGKKKRVQQRVERARKKKEIEERLQQEEDEEDKDIQEFLHD